MRSPGFWWSEENSLAVSLLTPLGLVYAALADRRLGGGLSPEIPVVCIGNFVAGGAGKTPFAIHVAQLFKKAGLTPAFLTRGYGGSITGPSCLTGAEDAAKAGDEPLLLARYGAVVVAKDRPMGLHLIEKELKPDVIIMDDGFQSARIKPSLSVVVLDNARGIGSGRVIPAGPLRASFSKQLIHADALFIMRGAEADHSSLPSVLAAAQKAAKPVFSGALRPEVDEAMRKRPALAFSGIGHPEKFFSSLRAAGIGLCDCVAFGDHHRFNQKDAEYLLSLAAQKSALLLTTEKDAVRLESGTGRLAELYQRTRRVAATTTVDQEEALSTLLLQAAGS